MKPSKEDISALLKGVAHPETGSDIVSGGFVDEISADEEKITVSLRFRKARDPFAAKIRDRVEQILAERWPEARITVFIREGEGREDKKDDALPLSVHRPVLPSKHGDHGSYHQQPKEMA